MSPKSAATVQTVLLCKGQERAAVSSKNNSFYYIVVFCFFFNYIKFARVQRDTQREKLNLNSAHMKAFFTPKMRRDSGEMFLSCRQLQIQEYGLSELESKC